MTIARAARFATLLSVALAWAPGPALAAGEIPDQFSCKFETGNTWTFDAGKFQSAPPSALSLEIQDINLETQAAKLIADQKPPARCASCVHLTPIISSKLRMKGSSI